MLHDKSNIVRKGPRAKSLDKTRGEQKILRIAGATEAVFGFLLCKDSWVGISGSLLMPTAFKESVE